jgi:hypothetical protein
VPTEIVMVMYELHLAEDWYCGVRLTKLQESLAFIPRKILQAPWRKPFDFGKRAPRIAHRVDRVPRKESARLSWV